ncbi:MAG: tetratricopeptide repeat protein [Calditrichaceae bacterium]
MSNIEDLFKSAGSDSILFAHKASKLLEGNATEDALKLCEKGVTKFPFYPEGHFILAKCYQALDRIDDAKSEFERTITYAPGHLKAINALAYIYYKKKLKQIGNELLLSSTLYDPFNPELTEFLKSENLYDVLYAGHENVEDSPVQKVEDREIPTEPEADISFDEKEDEAMNELIRESDKEMLPAENGTGYEKQNEFEANNIVDRLSEAGIEDAELDLSQYANVEDDFSTLMEGLFKEVSDEDDDEEVWLEIGSVDDEDEIRPEQELPAEERPILDTSIIFMEKKQDDQPDESQNASEFEANNSGQQSSKVEDDLDKFHDQISPGTEELEKHDFLETDQPGKPEHEGDDIFEDISGIDFKRRYGTSDKINSQIPDRNPTNYNEELNEDDTVTIEDIISNPSLITPTFGEILIAQRKFYEARHVFIELSKRFPENQRYAKKIDFLERLIGAQS